MASQPLEAQTSSSDPSIQSFDSCGSSRKAVTANETLSGNPYRQFFLSRYLSVVKESLSVAFIDTVGDLDTLFTITTAAIPDDFPALVKCLHRKCGQVLRKVNRTGIDIRNDQI